MFECVLTAFAKRCLLIYWLFTIIIISRWKKHINTKNISLLAYDNNINNHKCVKEMTKYEIIYTFSSLDSHKYIQYAKYAIQFK